MGEARQQWGGGGGLEGEGERHGESDPQGQGVQVAARGQGDIDIHLDTSGLPGQDAPKEKPYAHPTICGAPPEPRAAHQPERVADLVAYGRRDVARPAGAQRRRKHERGPKVLLPKRVQICDAARGQCGGAEERERAADAGAHAPAGERAPVVLGRHINLGGMGKAEVELAKKGVGLRARGRRGCPAMTPKNGAADAPPQLTSQGE